MNIRQLEAFHVVMETGSVTLAGERLGISQSAVSKLLKSLSESCGFKLFTRSGGRMLPTADARLLASEVERLFTGTDRIRRLARAVRDREWGHVTVAAPAAMSARFLALLLGPMVGRQGDIRVTLISQASPRVAELVAGQQIDIGLSVQPFEHPHVRRELVIRFAMDCAIPAGHRLADREVIRVEDLRNERFVGLARDDCAIMTIDRAFQLQGVQKQIHVEVPMSETACDFVASGAGISIVPPFVGRGYGADKIVRRPLLPLTTMDVWLLTPATRPPSLAAQKVAEVIRDGMRPYHLKPSDERSLVSS
ncbi:LysR substrate-binding domain-containing protein [Chelativorans sp. SCAU2101]|jgi:Transcriptional regulator|uniref:LysR substrate-binding domain-containing protein n=1 Tax=Chelativorans petroleitrophicus TaxID=2975484 RepID=A0A9X2XC72_9HYPH|nr:LysR substrate-binding domain-containing protein [Chelativorans petroleitrophicus]MCT8992126.1 LysR substrate-binding domain-containing protein [Chelativorans petroleitrophicus]